MEFQTFKQFLEYIESNYEEEEVIIIENFMAYYINEYRHFGKYNCQITYQDDLQTDKTGELHRLALIGFDFEKKIHDAREHKKMLKKNKMHD
jgi:hypothetical protein